MNEINGEINSLHIHNAAPPEIGAGGSGRPKDIRNRTQFERKMAGAYDGHPANYFVNIARLHWPTGYRTTNAYQIEGGGVLLQNSWYEESLAKDEDGRPKSFAIDHYGVYLPDCIIEEREFTDNDGEQRLGRVIVKRPRRGLWSRLFGKEA